MNAAPIAPPTIPTPVPLVAPSVAKTTPVVSSGTASNKVGDITTAINQASDAVAMNNAARKGWNTVSYSPDIKNANGQVIQAGQIIPQQEQIPDLGPDAGHVYIYDKSTGAQTQIPIGQQIPVGFSTVDINKAPAVDTVDTANATFKKFSDGTYGQFDASGKYVGAANAKNFMDAKNTQRRKDNTLLYTHTNPNSLSFCLSVCFYLCLPFLSLCYFVSLFLSFTLFTSLSLSLFVSLSL